MANTKQGPFLYDEDEESVATASTEESDAREDYVVEDILAEQWNSDNKRMEYLVKWDSYPLHRATFEPASNLGEVLTDTWKPKKARIDRGEEAPYNLDEYWDATEQAWADQERRRKLRKAKRRGRGIKVSPDDSDETAYDDSAEHRGDLSRVRSPSPKQSQRKQPKQTVTSSVKRKGLAQKVPRRRTSVAASDSNSSDSASAGKATTDSDADSLFDEGNNTRAKPQDKISRRTTRRVGQHAPQKTTSPLQGSKRPRKTSPGHAAQPASKRSQTSPPVHERGKQPEVSQMQKPTQVRKVVPSPAARKSAPSAPESVGQKAPAPNVFAGRGVEKKRKQLVRVSGETPKNSTEPLFRKLSIQNKHQRYHRNENAPDVDALKTFDPKSGTWLESKKEAGTEQRTNTEREATQDTPNPESNVQNVTRQPLKLDTQVSSATTEQRSSGGLHRVETPQTVSGEIDGAYRRRTPPPPGKQASKDASNPPLVQPDEAISATAISEGHPKHPAIQPVRDSYAYAGVPLKSKTCWFWSRGKCNYLEPECRFAHHDTGILAEPPGAEAKARRGTCSFWARGHCKKPEEACPFAHYDTGRVATAPGLPQRGLSVASSNTSATAANAVPVMSRAGAVDPSEGAGLAMRTTNEPQHRPPPAQDATVGAPASTRRVSFQPPPLKGSCFDTGGQSPVATIAPSENVGQSPAQNLSPRESTTRGHFAKRRMSTTMSCLRATLDLVTPAELTRQRLTIKLEVVDVGILEQSVGHEPCLVVNRAVMASDFENVLCNNGLRVAVIAAGGVQFDEAADLQRMIELCRSHAVGLVAAVDNHSCAMLIYPSKLDEWKFLDNQDSGLASSEGSFQFRLFSSLPGFSVQNEKSPDQVDSTSPHGEQTIAEALAGLDRQRLLPRGNGGRRPTSVFLMIPQTHYTELKVYVDHFQRLGCNVFHSGTSGAWQYFRKRHLKESLVLIHPEVSLSRIPGLHRYLNGSGAEIFSLGVDVKVALLEEREPAFGCERLFPYGTVAFITDDVFVYHPEKAAEIIDAFAKTHKLKPEGGERNRIVTRPGLKPWLLKLACEKTGDRGRKDARWFALYEAVCKLLPPEAMDPWDPENPLSTALVVSVPPELLPSFNGLWEKNETEATDYMVNWFAGWSVLHASRYRKFMVCHEPRERMSRTITDENGRMIEQLDADPDPKGWTQKFQHIGVAGPSHVKDMLVGAKKR